MTPIVDCHTHTNFSDGEPSFEENVRAAAEAGCSVLVSTDHLTLPASMDPKLECQVPEARLAEHRAAFLEAERLAHELTAATATPLELVYGFECDWYEGCEENVARWAADAVVRLGSVHWVGDPGPAQAGSTTAATSISGRSLGPTRSGAATPPAGVAPARVRSSSAPWHTRTSPCAS